MANHIELKLHYGECCCCLGKGNYRHLTEEYSWNGQPEIYEVLFKDTFDIVLKYPENTKLICDCCIVKLREATYFRSMVETSQQRLGECVTWQLESDNDWEEPLELFNVESSNGELENHDDKVYDQEDKTVFKMELLSQEANKPIVDILDVEDDKSEKSYYVDVEMTSAAEQEEISDKEVTSDVEDILNNEQIEESSNDKELVTTADKITPQTKTENGVSPTLGESKRNMRSCRKRMRLDPDDTADLDTSSNDEQKFELSTSNLDTSMDTQNYGIRVKVLKLEEIHKEDILNSDDVVDSYDASILNGSAGDETNDNSVLALLNSCIDGEAILSSGRQNGGLLDQTLRSRLARLIASHELTNNPSGAVPGSRLMKCALEIAKIFEKESPTIYYSPYMRATAHQIKRNASGKLYDAVVNRRKDLRKRGVLPGSSRSSNFSDASFVTWPSETEPVLMNESYGNESDNENKLHWLKSAVEPWHQVENNWAATTHMRLTAIQRNTESSVEDYLNLYPALKQPNGYRLLLQDFNYLYKNYNDCLYSNIVLYQRNIISVGKSKVTQLKDKDIKRDMQEIIDSISDEKPESETNAALLLLPYLVPSIRSNKKGKPYWKPSRSEICEGYIYHVVDSSEIQTKLANRREKLLKLGRTFQPFVLYTGCVKNIENVYVVVGQTNKRRYKVNSLLQGIDLAFKIIQATGTQYSDESYLVWLFIQRVLYNINTKFDRSLNVFNTLISDLNIT